MKNIVLFTIKDISDYTTNKKGTDGNGSVFKAFNNYDKEPHNFLENFQPEVIECMDDKDFQTIFQTEVTEYLNNNTIFSPIVENIEKSDFNRYDDSKKLRFFIGNPKKFTSKFCEEIIQKNNKLWKLFLKQNIWHIEDSNIYFCDCIDSRYDFYWGEIKSRLEMIKSENAEFGSLENIPIHLILHIGDHHSLEIRDASFFYKDNSDDIANWNPQVVRDLSDYKIETITAFHHSDGNKIYKDIIKNSKFWENCNKVDDKTDFITKEIRNCYDNDDLRHSIFNISGDFYHITNGKKEVKPRWEKLPKNIDKNYKSSNDYITLYAAEYCFKSPDFYIALANFQLRGCDIKEYESFIEKKNSINFGYPDAIDLRSLNPKFDCKNFKQTVKPIIIYGTEPLSILQEEECDQRINYLDSSIWLQYVHDQNTFEIAEANIKEWKALYETNNALEIVEFRARQSENSFLMKFEEKASHANYIAPFIFHSEAEMEKNAVVNKKGENEAQEDNELEKLNKKGDFQWRFLIVDDHATKQSIKEDRQKIIPKCKIINDLLSKYFNIECHKCKYGTKGDKVDSEECSKECQPKNSNVKEEKKMEKEKMTIWFDCAITMKEAIEKLEKAKYDLVLMDYLLDPVNPNEKMGHRNYAYDLLHKLEKYCEKGVKKEDGTIEKWTIKDGKIGPNGKFQIFYISAFTNTVSERMLEQRLDYHSDYWSISHGACPTTTPHLFLFYLLRRMNFQIEEFTELSKQEDLKDIITLLDLLHGIYKKDKNSREQAIKLFNPLLKLRLNYDNLKYDVCEKKEREMSPLSKEKASILVYSLFPDIEFYDNAFWEHVMHLVYLTAYGTIRQWHEMWDEFMLIKPYLQKAKSIIKEVEGKEIKIAEAVINGIENYITKLQEAQNK